MKYRSQIEALYMNISLNDIETVNSDEDIQVLEVTVLPPNYTSEPQSACIKEIFSAMNTCVRTNINNVVSSTNRFFIMLYHNQRITQIPQFC